MDDLPITLDETYERALKGIDKEKRDYASRLFHCLVVSIRPLRVEELAELFAILPHADSTPEFNIDWRPEDPEEFIISTCTTLVSIVNIGGERVIQFSHFSVREYLTSGRIAGATPVSHFYIVPKAAHTLLARACLSVLFQLDRSIDETKVQDFLLAPYAAKHWIDHARYEDVASHIQDEMDCLFDMNKPYFSVWIWLHDVEDSWVQYERSPHPTQPDEVPLYYAALCGFHGLSERLLDAHPGDVNARGGYYETPLQGALYKGHLSIVLLLLERGADAEYRDHNGQSALYTASSHGYSEVVRSLIDRGADLNTQCEDTNNSQHVRWTPLQVAIHKSRQDIALLLLESGADPESRYHGDQTALYMASSCGYTEIVRSLLDHGADLTAQCDDKDGWHDVQWTPLQVATHKGHLDLALLLLDRAHMIHIALYMASSCGSTHTVRSLIDRGADPNTKCEDNDGMQDVKWTPLQVASQKGYLDTVHLLLECGADPESRDHNGQTALYMASSHGSFEVVRSLIDRGADLKVECNDWDEHGKKIGRTPLHTAIHNGHLDITLFLLERGANMETRSSQDQTALFMASSRGFAELVRSLMGSGADLNAICKDCDGYGNDVKWTPLVTAIYKEHRDIALLLLEGGADTETRSSSDKTALYVASSRGYADIVRSLIDRGADLNTICKDRDGYGNDVKRTSLVTAIYKGHRDIALLLLEGGADTDTRSSRDENPLYMASSRGYAEVVQSLIDRGADLNAECDDMDEHGYHMKGTPLLVASKHRRLDIARTLLERGADVNYRDDHGWSALHLALHRQYDDLAQLLLDHGANPNVSDVNGSTTLHEASSQGRTAFVKLLFEYGANINARDKRGETALHKAARWGYLEVVQLLLDHGADTNAKGDNLWTSLHEAAWSGNLQVVDLLLKSGADAHALNEEGETSFQLASRENYPEVVQLLSERTGERI